MTKDKRPDPKPRKRAALWQAYLWWEQLMKMRIKSVNREISAERGKSNMSARFERMWRAALNLEENEAKALELMIELGAEAGPIWDWLISIKGIGESLAAQLTATIDDISLSPTVSSLWRFAGYAVIDGKGQRRKKGQTDDFNMRLKVTCYKIGEQFIKHHTPVYREIYDEEKERQFNLNPELIAMHIHRRAMRKMIKIFLQHVWLKWREFENLPVNAPYVEAILGHGHIIPPPEKPSFDTPETVERKLSMAMGLINRLANPGNDQNSTT